MRLILTRLTLWLARRILSLRYKVEVRGLEQCKRSGDTLVLANHAAYIDPVILILYLWPHFQVRPMLMESIARIPMLGWFFRSALGAVSIPSFQGAVNSYKIAQGKKSLQEVVDGLHRGENFLVYPSGRLKRTGEERIGGASGVHEVVGVTEGSEILLVRTTGLWGSLFSWALEGEKPSLPKGFARGFKILARNLFLFAPRRKVLVELEMAPPDLREERDRARFNQRLEQWFNAPFDGGPEPVTLVSYSRWRRELPTPRANEVVHTGDGGDPAIRAEVVGDVARLAHKKPEEISLDDHLFNDLGLDSLDLAHLAAALDRDGHHTSDKALDMMTVGGLIAMLSGEHERGEWEAKEREHQHTFRERSGRPQPDLAEGNTIQELFIRMCQRMGRHEAAADSASGVRTYRQLKERVLMLADYFKANYERETRIGVMLPASVAAQVVVFAIQLSGRIPVMINWTLGERYIDAMRETSGIQTIISSSAFLDRLNNADLTPVHNQIVTLESIASNIGLKGLLKAKWRNLQPFSALDRRYHFKYRHPDDHAVILFTSGTEALPKAVPLTHGNILSNLRDAGGCFDFNSRDIFLGMLPPFHSFGFSVTGCFPVLTGCRVFFSPDPTAAHQLASDIERAGVTTLCAAPTFLQAIFRAAGEGQLSSLRHIVSGAEKAPEALYEKVREIGADLLEGYGITECAPIVSINRPGEPYRGVGRVLDSMEMRIVDPETMEVRRQGESGLILLRGPNVFTSYLGLDVKWPFVELEDELWYETGDLGVVDGDGYLTLVGRLKRFVKMGGEMVSLPAMEEALMRRAAKEGWQAEPKLAVISQEVEGERPRLHLFANFGADLGQINDGLKQEGFSNLARLSRVHELDSLPALGSGKCDYRALAELANEG